VFYDGDADLSLIRSRRIAVIGYGNQGRAQSLNLRDSGCDVTVGLRPGGASWELAEAEGFSPGEVSDAAAQADVVSVLLPDQFHQQVYRESVQPVLTRGKMLLLAHGFSIHFRQVEPPADVDVAMVAPVGPGAMMRRLYLEGLGIPAVFAVHQNVTGLADELALAYSRALGCTRAGVLRTTFQEETETDLFGEQAVLCGGLSSLIKAGFDTLVEAGYQPELAYFECLHQIKLIVDLIYESGLSGMHAAISDTAEFGDRRSGPRIIDEHAREQMHAVLRDIRDGTFARAWIEEYQAGATSLRRAREAEKTELIEVVGRQLRSMMSRSQVQPAGREQPV
jgi:ketol-acid reductoisomerase